MHFGRKGWMPLNARFTEPWNSAHSNYSVANLLCGLILGWYISIVGWSSGSMQPLINCQYTRLEMAGKIVQNLILTLFVVGDENLSSSVTDHNVAEGSRPGSWSWLLIMLVVSESSCSLVIWQSLGYIDCTGAWLRVGGFKNTDQLQTYCWIDVSWEWCPRK